VATPNSISLLSLSTVRSLTCIQACWLPVPALVSVLGLYLPKLRSLTGLVNRQGLDIGGPPGTVVRSFHNCTVLHFGYNPAAYDYGHVIVTHQVMANPSLSRMLASKTLTLQNLKRSSLAGMCMLSTAISAPKVCSSPTRARWGVYLPAFESERVASRPD
jgi:hypothetical protein